MGGRLQKRAGKLATKKGRRTDQKRRGRIGPPRIVRPEILHCGAIDRQLVQPERGDVKDVIEVAGVTYAEVNKQVVNQHPQQHAVNQTQYINPDGLIFEVGLCRPQGNRRLYRPLAGQPQIHRLRLPRNEVKLEQVVVFFDVAAVERQGVARSGSQPIIARCVRGIQINLVHWRVRQLQQPSAMSVGILRLITQVQLDPEGRVGITGIQGVFIKRLEELVVADDICQLRRTTRIFKDLHQSAQGQALCGFVKIHCAGQHR